MHKRRRTHKKQQPVHARAWQHAPCSLVVAVAVVVNAAQLQLAPQLAVFYAPFTLLLARFAVGPILSTWTLIWFNVIFEVRAAP